MREFQAPGGCACVFCWDKPNEQQLSLGRPDLMDTATLIVWIDCKLRIQSVG